MANLLEIKGLSTYFYTEDGVVRAVDGVDLSLAQGETLCVVGESGSGKSVTSLSVMGLIERPGRIVAGEVLFDGTDLVKVPASEMKKLRGNRIAMIFQQPQSSLNPVFRVGDQIAEALKIHRGMNRDEAAREAVELLRRVGIPEAERRATQYPHEMSGGMAQRVMIAMALACTPDMLIADEPTTALDVTIQAQILDLMRELKQKTGVSILLITHDMGVVAEMADRVAVMYAGRIQEDGPVGDIFARPLHPYTVGLLNSIPVLGDIRDELAVIPGQPPHLANLPAGCRFAPRCLARVVNNLERCTQEEPDLLPVAEHRRVRCWLYHPDHRPDGEIRMGYEPAEQTLPG
ncbi:MAG: ABC transporter ATP-binding protein [Anaerolineae bacterium]|nr:ABC transporter ATP-binding protein [Anaerolineae bacterium]